MSPAAAAGLRIVVLASGNGTNLQAIIDAIRSGSLPVELVAVVSDKPKAFALERARKAAVPAIVVDYAAFPDRPSAEQRLAEEIRALRPGLIVLAGFMRILPDSLVNQYLGRMINVHPSLLPLYRGLGTFRRVLAAGDAWHGSTVHFVIPALDAGPALIQYRLPVNEDDTEESLAARVQKGEHIIYPRSIRWIAESRVELRGDRVWLDGKPLSGPVVVTAD